jgi:hypothetical protein
MTNTDQLDDVNCTKQETEKRISFCVDCDRRSDDENVPKCTECNCTISMLSSFRFKSCPIGKW